MKNGWKQLVKWHYLPAQDRLILIHAFSIVLLMQVGLKLLSFQQFRRLYRKLTETKEKVETPFQQIEREIWAIRTASRPLSALCLPQALALNCFLKKDRNVKLIVGVQKNHRFEAHAWVEKNGVVLIGELPNDTFKPLWTWQ